MAYDEKLDDTKLHFQLLAGACAGASQVLFTNPLEMVKVQLQGDLPFILVPFYCSLGIQS